MNLLFVSLLLISKPDGSTLPHFCSPTNADFVEYRYKNNTPVCKRNVNISMRLKVYADYNVTSDEHKNYTIDHLVPLFPWWVKR